MEIDRISLCTDFLLGILEFLILLIILEKTENYSSFQFSYYYYLVIAPFFGLVYLLKIIFWPISNLDATQDSHCRSADGGFTPNRSSQLLGLFQLLRLSLPNVFPIAIELVMGVTLITIKFFVTQNASINDLYLINYTPLLISILPLYLAGIHGQLSSKAIESIYNPYNFVGIILNTLVLLTGGLLGFNICNHPLFTLN
jgi:hypothetical protein